MLTITLVYVASFLLVSGFYWRATRNQRRYFIGLMVEERAEWIRVSNQNLKDFADCMEDTTKRWQKAIETRDQQWQDYIKKLTHKPKNTVGPS